jgi:hypothetical protein
MESMPWKMFVLKRLPDQANARAKRMLPSHFDPPASTFSRALSIDTVKFD